MKLRDGIRKSDKLYSLIRTCIKPTNKLVSLHSGAPLVLGQATGDPRLTRLTTARTRGKPPPFLIQYSLRLSTAPTSEWLFVPGLPRRSPKIVPVWTPGNLGAHNSQLRPLIGIRSKANLQLSSRAFQQCVTLHLHTPGFSRFPTFSGQESNWQFDSWPFFRPLLVLQMSEWLMQGHFRYLLFKTFLIV